MWIYSIPIWLLGVLIVTAFLVFALLGLYFARRWLHRRLGINSEANTPIGYFSSGLYVFYGLLVGLLAVGAWGDYQDVRAQVWQETAALNVLYRDVGLLPDSVQTELQSLLRTYVQNVIDTEWPAQQQGQWVTSGTKVLNDFQSKLATYRPDDFAQQTIWGRTLEEFDTMVEARRLRADAVNEGLPAPMWAVVLISAVLCVWTCYFFYVEDWRMHVILVVMLTTFVALAIFLTAAMDHPLQGDVSVPVDDFQTLLQRMLDPTLQN
jgi:hypothetical protein